MWVFVNENGRPIWKSNFERRVFHKALEKTEPSGLGHHSIKMTVDVYGHLVPGANRAAVDRLDEQSRVLKAAIGRGDAGAVQVGGEPIERNPKSSAGSRVAPQPRVKNWWS